KRMIAYDVTAAPLARLRADGIETAASVAEVAQQSDIVFLSLPGGPQVEHVVAGVDGLLAHGRARQVIVDLSTTPVALTRSLAERVTGQGMEFADAPVARTRQAAQEGTLSIMVGAPKELFDRIRPLLVHAASEITHCGEVGCG